MSRKPIVHNFTASNNIGSIGESLFAVMMTLAGYEIESVTTERDYQKRGIDFIVDTVYYDTKFDTKAQSTGNITLETISSKKEGRETKLGWSITTEADCVVYIYLFGTEWHMLFFTLPEMTQLLKKPYERKVIRNYGYEGEVVLVPIKDLDYKKVVKVPVMGDVGDLSTLHYIHNYLRKLKS